MAHPLMPMLERIRHSRLARQFATLLGGRFAAAVIQAVSIYLLARWSEVQDFGMFAAALGLAVTLQAVGDVGATTFVIRETAARGLNRSVAYAELLSRLMMGVIALSGVVAVACLSQAGGNRYLALLPMAGWIVADRSSDIRSAIARGLGDVRIGTINLLLRRLAQLALFALGYWLGVQVTWAYSLSLLLGSALILAAMWRRLPQPPRLPLRRHALGIAFLRCRPYWLHSAATQLRNVDTAIVAGLSGPIQASYYGLGARLMTPLRMLPFTLSGVLLPHFVKRRNERKKDISMGATLSLLIALPYLIIAAAAPWAVKHLGPDYAGATLPLQIMCVGLAGSGFISIFNTMLQAHGQARLVARISTLITALFILLIGAGTVVYGATGAAVGFMASTFVQAAMLFIRAKKHA